jgi:hypothetical protein
MSSFLIGLLLGLVIGATVGTFVVGICTACARELRNPQRNREGRID